MYLNISCFTPQLLTIILFFSAIVLPGQHVVFAGDTEEQSKKPTIELGIESDQEDIIKWRFKSVSTRSRLSDAEYSILRAHYRSIPVYATEPEAKVRLDNILERVIGKLNYLKNLNAHLRSSNGSIDHSVAGYRESALHIESEVRKEGKAVEGLLAEMALLVAKYSKYQFKRYHYIFANLYAVVPVFWFNIILFNHLDALSKEYAHAYLWAVVNCFFYFYCIVSFDAVVSKANALVASFQNGYDRSPLAIYVAQRLKEAGWDLGYDKFSTRPMPRIDEILPRLLKSAKLAECEALLKEGPKTSFLEMLNDLDVDTSAASGAASTESVAFPSDPTYVRIDVSGDTTIRENEPEAINESEATSNANAIKKASR